MSKSGDETAWYERLRGSTVVRTCSLRPHDQDERMLGEDGRVHTPRSQQESSIRQALMCCVPRPCSSCFARLVGVSVPQHFVMKILQAMAH
jgi:hypothetical protein